ncbi:MAG: DsbA family protein [Myxococcota bacterium]
MNSYRVLALSGALSLVAACQQASHAEEPKAKPAAAAPAKAAPSADAATFDDMTSATVVARWEEGGEKKQLTYGELKDARKFAFLKIDQQRHQAVTRELEGYLIDVLMDAEAKKAGKSREDFIQSLVSAVSADEAKTFYEQQKAGNPQMPPYEQIEGRIKEYLGMSQATKRVREAAKLEIEVPEPDAPLASFKLEGRPSKGPDDAKVTIVEFSDFQCPFCARATKPVDDIVAAYPDQVKVYFLHFPLSFHKQAMPAAVASVCAQKQGKFWEMHDKIFENQQKLGDEDLAGYAKAVGLDMKKFEKCKTDPATSALVQADMSQGTAAGVGGTPSFYINGKQHQGPPSVDTIKKLIEG